MATLPVKTISDSTFENCLRKCAGQNYTDDAIFANWTQLIQNGESVNYRNEDDFGQGPLHCAANEGHLPAVQFLVNHEAKVEATDERCRPGSGQTPLIKASINGHLKVVEYLISHGGNINRQDTSGNTGLLRASLGGHLSIVQYLISQGADINIKNYIVEANALLEAVYWDRLPVVKCLIQNGADIEERDVDGRTALYRAVTIEHKSIMKYLVEERGADVNASLKKKNNESPLHKAAFHGHTFAIEYLLSRGANPDLLTADGKTPCEVVKRSAKISDEKKSQIIKIFKEFKEKQAFCEIEKKVSLYQKDDDDDDVIGLLDVESNEFQQLLSRGHFISYENRLFLAGPCNVGKTSLASILIDEEIPHVWDSTNGLEIWFGRNGIHIKDKKMIPLPRKKGHYLSDVYEKVICGKPTVTADMDWTDLEIDVTPLPPNHSSTLEDMEESNQRQVISHAESEEYIYSRTECKSPYYNNPTSVLPSKIQNDILEQIKKGEYRMEIAPSDIVDFGGQQAFDMTHQLFIRHRGIVLLMFDGSKDMNTELKEEYRNSHVTTISILEHWINSILTYCLETDDGMPQIVFVATHSDKVTKVNERREQLQIELNDHLKGHKKKNNLQFTNLFFINATDVNDPEIDRLKDRLVNLAMTQPTWKEQIPMAWVPLLIQLDDMRSKRATIIKTAQIEDINKRNNDLALTESQLTGLLKHQHRTGKILYFDDPGLNQFVIIQPTTLVNILRSFITDEMFWPEKHKCILERLNRSGKLRKSDLLKIWLDKKYEIDLPSNEFKDFVIKLLVHLDIIVKPVRDNQSDSDFSFYVPCMVRATDLHYFDENIRNRNIEERICLAYKLALPVVPPALAFHFIGAAVNIWPVCEKDGKSLLFYNSAVLYIDKHNELLIRVEGNTIILYLVNQRVIPRDITASIQECLTSALYKIVSCYYKTFESCKKSNLDKSKLFSKQIGFVCQDKLCVIDVEEAIKRRKWTCKFQKQKQHEARLPLSWIFDERNLACSETCPGLTEEELKREPTDKQLLHFAKNMGIDDFVSFALHIGVSEGIIQNYKFLYKPEPVHIMFMILHYWKSNTVYPTFTDLLQGLITSDMNGQRQHLLCHAIRQKSNLLRISGERLAKLTNVPLQPILKDLSHEIGDCYIELGIELELKVNDIIAISVENASLANKMYTRNYDILMKWKQSCPIKPTTIRLISALENVGKGGLDFLAQHYFGKRWNVLLQSDQANN
ncbi:unnamed protein product [Mytilus coruscus]|uniref:COR domain-containing protein n=1 Tax=Mytilus coruscus TaxID=42192 RepID=A0A6J8EMA3_MYTCO|nr:unnamed protein product [Mytilus coruscus]